MTDKLDILFTCAGQRVSLLRAFHRAAAELGVALTVHAADCRTLAPALYVADRPVLLPPIQSGHYPEALLKYCQDNDVRALVPLIDTELQLLSDRREQFERIGTRMILSSAEVMRVCMDKVLTSEFLARHGFRTPRILGEPELADAPMPLFMKPRSGSASVEARKISSHEELAFYRKARPDSIVQEFVRGIEHTVDVFADLEGRPRCAVPRRRHRVRAGEVSRARTVRHPRMIAEASRVVRELAGCVGMITIQCFLTPADQIVFIEINPRFGGGVPLSIRAGADSPRWLLELLTGREPAVDPDGWTDGLCMLRYDDEVFVKQEDLVEEQAEALDPPDAGTAR